MAKYTSDTTLISGAGKAYKNWDNVPGTYAGLDKIIEGGQEMAKQAIKDKEAAEKEKSDQDTAWYKVAGEAYENAGSFQKDVEYNDTVSALNELQPRWTAAMNGGTAEEKAAVNLEYNNIKNEIDDHKAFREEITDPEFGLSDALSNSGVEGGNDARDKTYLTGLIAEEYEISRNENGEKIYTVDGVSKTMKEIKEMAILKDAIPFSKYEEARKKRGEAKNFDREATEFDMRTNVVPKTYNELRAFVSDAGHGSGENLADLLRKDKKGIMDEIDKELFDTNTDGRISDEEFEEFIQAVVDPYHVTWENEDGTHNKERWQKHTTAIAIERLSNGIENTHRKNHPIDPPITDFDSDWVDPEDGEDGEDGESGTDGTSGTVGDFDLDAFFGPEADEENAVQKLQERYPGIEIYSPFMNPYEKIVVDGEEFFLRGANGNTPEQEKQRLQKKLENINNSPTFDPGDDVVVDEKGEVVTETATSQNTSTQTTSTTTAPTWRSNKKIESKRVDKFNVIGSAGKNKANINKNGKPINVKVGGGMATVTGVRAQGDELIVDVEAPFNLGGAKTMGKFVKSGNGFEFHPNAEIYDKLKGEDKKDFDTFILAIETDPAFAMKVMESVQGENDFNPVDYK